MAAELPKELLVTSSVPCSASRSTAELTLLLHRWQAGESEAEKKLWPILYGELEALASGALRRRGGSPTLQTADLLNEACLRLLGSSDCFWQHRGHFFAFAATVMRHVLVDHVRRRQAAKRQGAFVETPPEMIADPGSGRAFGVLEIDQALTRLAEISPRYGRLVELRFFGGLSVDEAAVELEISKATAIRDWRAARAWLYGQLRSTAGESS